MSVSRVLFSLSPLNGDAYQLDASFIGSENSVVSRRRTVFQQKTVPEVGQVFDIWSHNGVACSPIAFSSRDIKELRHAVQRKEEINGLSVVALDLQDEQQLYRDKEQIQRAEGVVCDFYRGKQSSDSLDRVQKVQDILVRVLPVDSVLCEGRLKCDLLGTFSEQEIEFFLKKGTGSLSFCQYAEFFMNAFKMGQEPTGMPIFALNYFESIRRPFHPQLTSTVWYPASYKDLYSFEGSFMKEMRNVFSLTELCTDPESKITAITMRKKS